MAKEEKERRGEERKEEQKNPPLPLVFPKTRNVVRMDRRKLRISE